MSGSRTVMPMLRAAADSEIRLNVAVVDLEDLHQVLVRAVAEGRGPDVTVIDSVRVRYYVRGRFAGATKG